MIKKKKRNGSARRVLVTVERKIVSSIPGAGLRNKGTVFSLSCKWLSLCTTRMTTLNWYFSANFIACQQVLRGGLAVGREKEGEIATTSELSYFSQSARSGNECECEQILKTRAKGNYVITNIISANQNFCIDFFDADIQIPETQLLALLPFPVPPPERPGELTRRLINSLILKESAFLW